LALIALAFGFLGMMVGVFIIRIVHPEVALFHAAPNIIDGLIAQTGLNLPVVATLLVGMPRVARFSLRELGFVAPTWSTVGIAIAGTVAAVLVVAVVGQLVDALLHQQHHQQAIVQMFLKLHNPAQIAFFALFAVTIAPVTEELFFRTFLFNIGLRHIGLWGSAIASSVLFGLAHGSLTDAIPLACVGIVFALVYYRTRNAYASMISHALFNAFSIVGLLFAPKLAGG
jgi:membrane protease YdiL (CAAX protease family)